MLVLSFDIENTKNWRNTFPRVLNGYEFEFISNFSLLLSAEFPDVIFHFIIGSPVALKVEDKERVEQEINLIAMQVSESINMKPSIQMEAKYFKVGK